MISQYRQLDMSMKPALGCTQACHYMWMPCICWFYANEHNVLLINYSTESHNDTEDLLSVREALFTIIKHYVIRGISMEDLQAILMFIHTVDNVKVVS